LSEVYEAAVSVVAEANAQLVEKMTKSAGFVLTTCNSYCSQTATNVYILVCK